VIFAKNVEIEVVRPFPSQKWAVFILKIDLWVPKKSLYAWRAMFLAISDRRATEQQKLAPALTSFFDPKSPESEGDIAKQACKKLLFGYVLYYINSLYF
jgi:hypothetical protein